MLFSIGKNTLIRDEWNSVGTLDEITVHYREIFKRVFELNAAAIVVVHDHPSGDTKPSLLDIDMARILQRLLQQIGVLSHDHAIVGASRCYSMRKGDLI